MTRRIRGGRSITGGPSRKHFLALLRHSTLGKLANLARCETERLTGKLTLASQPYILKLELANACNLRCPGCPTGLRMPGRAKRTVDPEMVRSLIGEIGRNLYIAHLYNWGEPMLHPRASEIVRMIAEANVYTSMSSHLSLHDFDRIESICRAGLSHLIVSIDGITQESYARYRKGGDLNLVLSNLKRLVRLRSVRSDVRTTIEWQMLSLRSSEAELDAAFALAREIGVDWFRTRAPIAPAAEQPTDAARRGHHHGHGAACAMPWRYLAVQSDGAVSACCNTFFPEDDFGGLRSGSVRHLKNSARFEQARRLATRRGWVGSDIDPGHPCLRCPVLHRSPMAPEILSRFPEAQCETGFMAVLDRQRLKYGLAWGEAEPPFGSQ